MILFSIVLYADPLYQRLSLFHQGDTVVVDFQQSIWVISVEKEDENDLVFSLVTATKDVLLREHMDQWLTWYEQGYPSASSHELITIRKHPFQVLDGQREKSKIAWISALFQLNLSPISEADRKKAGPPPRPGETDFRHAWQPKLIVRGTRVDAPSKAFTAVWPEDGSQLSMKKLVLYFPVSPKTVQAFPYWIESEGGSYHAAVIDSKINSP
jgi:hypothetical protein